jgi:hypothetical protein
MLLDREVTLIIKYIVEKFHYEKIVLTGLPLKNKDLSILFRLFFRNLPVKRNEVEAVIGKDFLAIFLKKGIFRYDEDFFYSLIKISVCGDFYFISTSIPFYKDFNSRVYIGSDSYLLSEDIKRLFSISYYEKGLDLCCGSGIQAITLSNFCSSVTGSDINPQAIVFATNNSLLNSRENVKFTLSDLYKNVEDKYDIIVSNPPFGFFPDSLKSWLPGFGGDLGIEIPLKIIEGFHDYLSYGGKGFICLSSPVIDGKEPFLEKLKDLFYGKKFSIKARIIEESICPDMIDFHKEKKIKYFKYYHIVFEKGEKSSFIVERFPLRNKIYSCYNISIGKLMNYYNKYKQKKEIILCEKFLSDAKIAISHGNLIKAKKTLKKILTLNPYDIEAHVTLGDIYLKEGYSDMAEEYFEDSLKLCPDMILPYCRLGCIYIKKNREKAREFLGKALSLAEEQHDEEMKEEIKKLLSGLSYI